MVSSPIQQDNRPGVMQVIDSLEAGGAERVAVNIANLLPPARFRSYLCATRRGGPLEKLLAPHVKLILLNRHGRFDAGGLGRLVTAVREHRIGILHAHGTSLFITRLASLGVRQTRLLWHDHYGRCELGERSALLYRAATNGVGVIAVNQMLADWASLRLHVPSQRIWYIPNWVDNPPLGEPVSGLPGQPENRVVCVANLRMQKDHPTLLHAFPLVLERVPEAHLLLIGQAMEPRYANFVRQLLKAPALRGQATLLGPRTDVPDVLRQCAIGVLSSTSEGLPLALLEYGAAHLPAVATRVGHCAEVLEEGRCGILVPPSDPEALASALGTLLADAGLRHEFGEALAARIESHYDRASALRRITAIYESVLPVQAA